MRFRVLVAGCAVSVVALVASLAWGFVDEWGDGQIAVVVAAAAASVVLTALAAAIMVRRILRLLQSTQKYSRLSSERTALMRPQIGALAGSVRDYARTSVTGVRENRQRLDELAQGGGRSPQARADRRRQGPTMIVALGAEADDPALHDLLRSSERGEVVLVTDRAELVPRIARQAAVEFVQLPSEVGTLPVTWLATRLLELAVEHGAAALVEWPYSDRVGRVRVDGLASLSVVGEDVLRAVFEASSERKDDHVDVLVERIAHEARGRERSLVDQLTKATGKVQHAVETLDGRSERRHAAAVRELRSELSDVYRQLESLTALYRMFEGSSTLPHLRGWAVSPDLAVDLLAHVLSGRVRSILELGSGASTVLFAMALERAGAGHVVSLDHEEDYAAQTRDMLESYGVAHRATVLHAPLVPQRVDGDDYSWYRLDGLDLPRDVDLLFIDGPPEATGPRSRYPALPLLESYLGSEALVVLDDGRRPDEEEIARTWAQREGIESLTTLPHERRPMLLSFRRPAGS